MKQMGKAPITDADVLRRMWMTQKLTVSVLILLTIAFGFGTNRGISLETGQTGQKKFNQATVDWELLCMDPSDPTVTDEGINALRERFNFPPLPVGVLRRIRQRMGIPEPPVPK